MNFNLTARFYLRRLKDESGVSGTGIVAVGVIFPNGRCVLSWLTEHTSTAVYDDIHQLTKIHGHDGKTLVVPFSRDIDEWDDHWNRSN
jgi:hypothetical protein